jgi:aromatic-L-amino-acid/L-tryptophan decarboxylase
MDTRDALRYRIAPLEMTPSEFRKVGRQLIERIAEFLCTLPERPVTVNESPRVIREALGTGPLPEDGAQAKDLLEEAADLLFEHSTFNGHPRFWGVITSSAAPIGALGDLLAASVNPNLGGWIGGPIANEIEAQTIRWMAQLIGYPTDCGGLLVSGGNMGNFVGLLAARKAKASWDVRTAGLMGEGARRLRVYTGVETHTWIQKATDMFGLGTDAIRWIPVDTHLCMDTITLSKQIQADSEAGDLPFLVIGTAGTVSTGAVDPLFEIAAICREYDLWFHVDGAYGGFAAVLRNSGQGKVPADLKGISEADSVAVDPHKWLYAPLEVGCALVRKPEALRETFSYHPAYYHWASQDEPIIDYHDYGPQNSRGFRALKVWLALRQVGRAGYEEMISNDIQLAQELYRLVEAHPELQAFTRGLSITTFRYVPPDLIPDSEQVEVYLNQLNTALLHRLQRSGEAFLSNAVVRGTFLLRACVVNFRTSLEDIEALPPLITRMGREIDATMRPIDLNNSSKDLRQPETPLRG